VPRSRPTFYRPKCGHKTRPISSRPHQPALRERRRRYRPGRHSGLASSAKFSLDEPGRGPEESTRPAVGIAGNQERELDYAYAKNQMLPQLDPAAQYWSPGLSGESNPLSGRQPADRDHPGKVSGGSVPGAQGRLGLQINNWSVELSLTSSLSSVFSRPPRRGQAGLDHRSVLMKKPSRRLSWKSGRPSGRPDETSNGSVRADRPRAVRTEARSGESKLQGRPLQQLFVLNYQRDLALAKTAQLRP